MSVLALLWLCGRALVVALVWPMLIGFGATRLVPALRRARPTLPQHFFLGFLGGGMEGLLLYGAGAPWQLVLGVLGGLALLGVPGLVREVRSVRTDRFGLMLGALLLPLLVAGVVYCCWDLVTGEDATALWLARVRMLQAWVPVSEFAALEVAQPSYPFLGAFWWWLVTKVAAVPVEAGRVVFLVAYLLFFVDLANVRKRAWPVMVLVAALAYAFYREEWIGGYQDGLVMICFAWAALILSRHAPGDALAFVPFLACVAGIKFEGGVLALMLVGAWAMFHLRDVVKTPVRMIVGAVSLVIVPALWPLMLRLGGATNTSVQGGTFAGVTPRWLVEQAWRVPVVVREIVRGVDATLWIVVVACVVGAIVSVKRRRVIEAWMPLVIAVHLMFLVVVFWTTHAPFEWHVRTALLRLQWQAALLWAVWLVAIVDAGRARSSAS